MMINVCVGKNGQKDFPEVAKVEVESIDKFLGDQQFFDIVEKAIDDIISKESTKIRFNKRYIVKRTVFVKKDNNLFVWIG